MNERLTPEHRAELRATATEAGTGQVTMTARELAVLLDALDTTERRAETYRRQKAGLEAQLRNQASSIMDYQREEAARVGVDTEEKPQWLTD